MTSTDGFLSQIISNAENVSMAWRHLSILMFQYTNPDYTWCGFHVSLAYTIVKYDPWSIPLRRSPHFHLFNGRSLTLRRHEATSPAATAYIGIWRRQKDRQSNLIENSIRVRNLVDTASMRSTRHTTLAQRYKTAMIFETSVGGGWAAFLSWLPPTTMWADHLFFFYRPPGCLISCMLSTFHVSSRIVANSSESSLLLSQQLFRPCQKIIIPIFRLILQNCAVHFFLS